MKKRRVEVTGINAVRWAWLHLPVGILLALALLIRHCLQEGADVYTVHNGMMVFFIYGPVLVLIVMFVGLVQAEIINLFLRGLRRGPIIEVHILDEEDDS